jgi:hypothetical protein
MVILQTRVANIACAITIASEKLPAPTNELQASFTISGPNLDGKVFKHKTFL